jgi:hypothetical protein
MEGNCAPFSCSSYIHKSVKGQSALPRSWETWTVVLVLQKTESCLNAEFQIRYLANER